ncbi:hypothetical protein QYE76_014144 [Lolium multiflorum]|uniref:TF-B3 domain-containing protein n=1 Tax=Lolium multiflorum TaxID=4521 RepID=A0AAD8U2G4_LOLMU|nr:hypothetical protein QYE76_014144 [Lolium multiflorum]
MEAPPAATYWTLPSDLLLEIVARSDISTVVAFALACKLLRRDILSSSFIRHLTQRGGIVPPCILAYLHTHDNIEDPPAPFSLVHPATPAASAFLNDYISPSVSRFAHELLAEHKPLTSRGGLVLFRRRRISNKLSNLCVYEVFSGRCTVFSDPIDPNNDDRFKYVLLTAADGIDCPFLICVLHQVALPHDSIDASPIEVHTTTSMSNTWAHTINININSGFFRKLFQQNIVVLRGGVIHWLARESGEIASYNVCTREHGTIKLPGPVINFEGQLHLGSYYSHDENKLLSQAREEVHGGSCGGKAVEAAALGARAGRGRHGGATKAPRSPSPAPSSSSHEDRCFDFLLRIDDDPLGIKRLPDKFAEFVYGVEPVHLQLREASCNFCRWTVEVLFDGQGKMYLHTGWDKFARDLVLEPG